jgi:hypothetical protein
VDAPGLRPTFRQYLELYQLTKNYKELSFAGQAEMFSSVLMALKVLESEVVQSPPTVP